MTIDLGPQLGWRESHSGCTFNPDPDNAPVGDCGQAATHHIRLRDDLGMVAACAEHKPYALRQLPVLDWHAWMAWCNMPGALWHPSETPDEADSWCSLDDSADASSARAKAEATA